MQFLVLELSDSSGCAKKSAQRVWRRSTYGFFGDNQSTQNRLTIVDAIATEIRSSVMVTTS